MTLVANGQKLSHPSDRQIAEAFSQVDGRSYESIEIRRPSGETLSLIGKLHRGDIQFFATVDSPSSLDRIKSKHSDKPLSEEQAIEGAQAFAKGKQSWPITMRWKEEHKLTEEGKEEAHQFWNETSAAEKAVPIVGALAMAAISSFLYDFITKAGFANLIFDDPDLFLTFVVSAVASVGLLLPAFLWIGMSHTEE